MTYTAVRLSKIQLCLFRALQEFLYYSFTNGSAQIMSRCKKRINSDPLAQLLSVLNDAPDLASSRYLNNLSRHQLKVEEYAEVLAQCFCLWEQILPKNGGKCRNIPLCMSFEDWLISGGSAKRYKPVHRLRRLIQRHGDSLFRKAIVHGSVATLDDTVGFSDMDLAFLVRTSVLKVSRQLLHLRDLAAQILTLTYAFDPFMHHGPYYLSEIDLAWYPEAIFPPVIFSYGVDLMTESDKLSFCARPSEEVTDQMLLIFEDLFEKWSSSQCAVKDSYDLEWILGNAMILPALYLQRLTGEFRYKRDTFLIAEKDFLSEEWEPIRSATEIRARLGPRPKPSPFLVSSALLLRWPGLLQKWARRHSTSVKRALEAHTMLGPDYPRRVLRLLRVIRVKLAA